MNDSTATLILLAFGPLVLGIAALAMLALLIGHFFAL